MVAVASLPKEIAAGLHPKQNNAIRGLLLQSGWVVEKLEDNSCAVTYVVQVINIFIVPKCSLHSSILKKKNVSSPQRQTEQGDLYWLLLICGFLFSSFS